MNFAKLENQFRRLLLKCELFSRKQGHKDAKFQDNLDLLDTLLAELESIATCENDDLISNYSTRLNTLKNIEKSKIFETAGCDSVRLRQTATRNGSDLMDVIDEKQHEIVENMSNLVKRLKENAVNSRQIIRKDIQTISNSSTITDLNSTKLITESEKLREHTKQAFKLYVWIIIIAVTITFVGMVMFMKAVKKSS